MEIYAVLCFLYGGGNQLIKSIIIAAQVKLTSVDEFNRQTQQSKTEPDQTGVGGSGGGFSSHQQQVLSGDPDGVRERVVILILNELLGVCCPHFDLKPQEGAGQQSGPDPTAAARMLIHTHPPV